MQNGEPSEVAITNWGARVAVGLLAALAVGVPLLFVAAVIPSSLRPLWAIAVTVGAIAALLWALRIRLVLREDMVVVVNYVHATTVPVGDIEAVVPSYVRMSNPTQGRVGCAGIRVRATQRTIPSMATMSWGWRFGKPSRQAEHIVQALSSWSHRVGVPIQVTPDDLVRATRGTR